MRAGAGQAPLEIGREASSEHLCRDGRGLVHESRVLEPELAAALGERRLESRQRMGSRRRQRLTRLYDTSIPRLHGVGSSHPCGRTPQRCVPLRDGLRVLGRERRTRWKQPADHAVDVRAADGGPGLHHREAVRREDKRGRGRSDTFQRLGYGSVDPCPLSFAWPKRDFQSDLSAVTATRSPYVEAFRAMPHEIRILPGSGREALRGNVQRLEKVRLAGAVRPGREHEPRLQGEIQGGVRAEVAKCEARDDQSGSRMGMIR